MPQKLLNGNQIHSTLVIVSSTRPAQGVRTEPLRGWPTLLLHQIPQPVAQRPTMQRPARLVGKEHR